METHIFIPAFGFEVNYLKKRKFFVQNNEIFISLASVKIVFFISVAYVI